MSDKNLHLFTRLRGLQERYETLPPGKLRCPICWELNTIERFTREHFPPQSVRAIVGEKSVPILLTCKGCNDNAGFFGQEDLRKLVLSQCWLNGNYDAPIRVRLRWTDQDEERRELRAETQWHSRSIRVARVPEANGQRDVDDLKKHLSKLDEFSVSFEFHHPRKAAWGLLHSAYLFIVGQTHFSYAYSHAGRELRHILEQRDTWPVQNYCLKGRTFPVPGPASLMILEKPAKLRCYLVKIAGQLVLMPLSTDGISLFNRWWRHSSVDTNYLHPRIRRLSVKLSRESVELFRYLPIGRK